MSNDSKMVKGIYDQMKAIKAGEAHVTLHQPYGDKKATAVISVYDEQRPSHEVLNDLYEWADETLQSDLVAKIEKLSELKEEK